MADTLFVCISACCPFHWPRAYCCPASVRSHACLHPCCSCISLGTPAPHLSLDDPQSRSISMMLLQNFLNRLVPNELDCEMHFVAHRPQARLNLSLQAKMLQSASEHDYTISQAHASALSQPAQPLGLASPTLKLPRPLLLYCLVALTTQLGRKAGRPCASRRRLAGW